MQINFSGFLSCLAAYMQSISIKVGTLSIFKELQYIRLKEKNNLKGTNTTNPTKDSAHYRRLSEYS